MSDRTEDSRPLRIAALVKQIPAFEVMQIGADGRLQREGVPLEMSAFCRRAVAEGVVLAGQTGGSCTVFTLGPPSAEQVLREALAYGADDGVLITDPAFAGSDTLATARALAAALGRRGAFDLILVGRNSVDSETGQVGPELAQLLDLPFATGVKQLELDATADLVRVGCEQDDAWLEATVTLPAVLSTAERLIDPCKVKDDELLAAVDASRIERVTAADLGPGPWGQAGSPTIVGEVRIEEVSRGGSACRGPVADQLDTVLDALERHGLLGPPTPTPASTRRATPARRPTRWRARCRARRKTPRPRRIRRSSACWSSRGASVCCVNCSDRRPRWPQVLGGRVVAIGESLIAARRSRPRARPRCSTPGGPTRSSTSRSPAPNARPPTAAPAWSRRTSPRR